MPQDRASGAASRQTVAERLRLDFDILRESLERELRRIGAGGDPLPGFDMQVALTICSVDLFCNAPALTPVPVEVPAVSTIQ